MSNLLTTLTTSLNAIEALQRSAAIGENNIANASAPGYARQRAKILSRAFDPERGLVGGSDLAGMISARDLHLEASVRGKASALGSAEELLKHLQLLEAGLALDDHTGIAPAMGRFYTAARSWSVSPADNAAKAGVIESAREVAASINRVWMGAHRLAGDAEAAAEKHLSAIQDLAVRIRDLNVERRFSSTIDPGLDAAMHQALEELSEHTDIQALPQGDGTITVLTGGQAPLVVGDRTFELTLMRGTESLPAGSLPHLRVLDAHGEDVTHAISGGRLHGALAFHNGLARRLLGSGDSPGMLNRLAESFAGRVNEILTSGESNPAPARFLFAYEDGILAARTLRVTADFAPTDLTAADLSTNPRSANGRALALAGLAVPERSEDKVDGYSFTEFAGLVSAEAGRAASKEVRQADAQRQLLTQARTIRAETSAVSLDEEAISLLQTQRAYQATARMIAILSEMSEVTIRIGQK